jgi:hypothetical protein
VVRIDTIGIRALQATGVLLAGVVLTGCGELPQSANAPAPPVHNAQTQIEPVPSAAKSSAASATSQSQSSGGQTPPVTASPRGEQQVERCHTSMLSGSVQPGDPGAGQRYAELSLRNTSRQTCTLYGYGGLQLIGRDGKPVPTKLTRQPNPGPAIVRLAPGEAATATLHWTAVAHEGEPQTGPCQPEPAEAQVIPPDETDPLSVRWGMGSVCGFGAIDGTAYHR